jgi:hypothetical protein
LQADLFHAAPFACIAATQESAVAVSPTTGTTVRPTELRTPRPATTKPLMHDRTTTYTFSQRPSCAFFALAATVAGEAQHSCSCRVLVAGDEYLDGMAERVSSGQDTPTVNSQIAIAVHAGRASTLAADGPLSCA